MVDDNGWVRCPKCKKRTKTKVNADTVLYHFPLFCQRCKLETVININLSEKN